MHQDATMPKSFPFSYEYARAALTVDVVFITLREEQPVLLLIQRKSDPFAGKWALPGGFVNPDEPLETAAARELEEETGLKAGPLFAVNGFGDPGRDPRGWTVTVAYYTLAALDSLDVHAGDDASLADWHRLADLPPLAFDHDQVIAQTLSRFRREIYAAPILAPFLGKSFLLDELAAIYSRFDPDCVGRKKLRDRLLANGVIENAKSKKPRRYRFPIVRK